MKNSVSPGVMAAIIAAVVVVVGFLGYRMFLGGPGAAKPNPAKMQQMQQQMQQGMQQNYRPGGGPPMGGPPPGYGAPGSGGR